MNHRHFVSLSALAALIVFVSLASVPAGGQAPAAAPKAAAATWKAPRTPWGEPDLQGVWRYEGVAGRGADLERRKEFGAREFLTDAEIAERVQAEKKVRANIEAGETNGEAVGRRSVEASPIQGNEYNAFWQETFREKVPTRRTSMIVGPDGRIPYRPEVRQEIESRADIARGIYPTPFFHQSWLEFNVGERCLTDGVQGALLGGPAGGPSQFVQSPGWLGILIEARPNRITLPTDGRPHGNVRDWNGDAVGHWDGDTLVVETTNFMDKTQYRWNGWTRPTETLKLVERFTRISPDTIDYWLTIEDPTTFTKPWTLTFPLTKLSVPLVEYTCHEGNYGVLHPLSQTRNLEKAAAGKKDSK